MPHEPFTRVGARTLIRAKHTNELQEALENTYTVAEVDAAIAVVDDAIPGLVTDALADDEVLQDAVATTITSADIPGQVDTAVDADIAARDIIETQDILEDGYAFAIVDEDGRRTWLEAAADGGLTTRAVEKIEEHITGATDMADSGVNGLSFAIVDEDGRRTWLEANEDGGPSDHALALIADGIGQAISEAETVFPSDDWAHWGDSLTAAVSSGDWPTKLAVMTGKSHYDGGWGGQGVDQIAGRQGGVPPRVTLTSNQIPATGAVALTDISYTPLSNSGSRLGSISDIEGTLAQDGSGNLTFTRSVDGDAVAVEAGEFFMPWHGEQYRDRIVTLWVGRNDFVSDSIPFILSRIQAMIDYLSPTVRRVIVMEIPPSTSDTTGSGTRTTLDALNLAIQTTFRPYYLDIASWLRTSAAATAAGITFTGTDTTDIANGVTPTSFRSDGIHFNTDGGEAIAYRVYQEAQLRGWIA